MNWYKIAQDADIEFIEAYNVSGADFVLFRIGINYWAYRLSFSDYVKKIRQLAKYNQGRALAYAKKKKSEECKVTKDFPAFGSIIKCSKDKEEDKGDKENEE